MGQNFDQAKCDNTSWPRPNILHQSVITKIENLPKNPEKVEKNFDTIWFHRSEFFKNSHKNSEFLQLLFCCVCVSKYIINSDYSCQNIVSSIISVNISIVWLSIIFRTEHEMSKIFRNLARWSADICHVSAQYIY